MTGFRVIDCDDLPWSGDKVHYTTKSTLELGGRYAVATIESLKVQKRQKKVP